MRTNRSSLRHDPVSMSDARRAFSANPLAAFFATGFGSGLSPVAPGTAGSVVGLVVAWLLRDHGGILGTPVGLLMSGLAIAAVGVARRFDVVKPGPIRRVQDLPGGWGVVMDDVAAGILAGFRLAAGGWAAGLAG